MQVPVGCTVERAISRGLAIVAETVTVTGETLVLDIRKSGVSTRHSSDYLSCAWVSPTNEPREVCT